RSVATFPEDTKLRGSGFLRSTKLAHGVNQFMSMSVVVAHDVALVRKCPADHVDSLSAHTKRIRQLIVIDRGAL
ncbi:MAG TPA: hypothetical protein VJR48_04360, partial [Ktedonobacterales bacterium]|nr:hypothetical protein [Ktedonobacterales bacterium]